MLYNVVLVSAIHQHESAIGVFILFCLKFSKVLGIIVLFFSKKNNLKKFSSYSLYFLLCFIIWSCHMGS